MVQPLMALLTVLGAAGAPASEPGCPVETRAGVVVATPARCEEVAALREERERLLQCSTRIRRSGRCWAR